MRNLGIRLAVGRALVALIAFASAARAQVASNALLAACNTPSVAEVIHAAARTDRDARAYWLNTYAIQWPGMTGRRVVLHRSARAALRAEVGSRVTGSDESFELFPLVHELPQRVAERFKFIGSGTVFDLPVHARARRWELLRDQVLLVREDAEGRVIDATEVQIPGALDEGFGLSAVRDLTPQVRAKNSSVGLWAPTARSVTLCLYPSRSAPADRALAMELNESTGVWDIIVTDDLRGASYLFIVEVYVRGVGMVRNRVTDPYAVALTADSKRSVFLDLDDPRTMPAGWRDAARPAALTSATDLAVYELHVRDFSVQDTTVRPEWRGKYLAFSEPRSAGMRHLRLLANAGMTDVHLLPTYDLASVPEVGCVTPQIPNAAPDAELQQAAVSPVAERDCFNWGYDPFHYSVPEGSYATDPDDGATRIREFRQMVMSMHAAGLRVGIDVVYNHTMASGQDARSVLDRIVPGYYHRLDANGRVERSTCCDNTATEHEMMAKLIIESAVRWVRHYGIDSFRFDLMGHQPRWAMERLQAAVDSAAGRHIPLVGEGWNFGEIANGARFVQASQLSLQGSGIATFSDRARDALRGGGCCDGGEGLVANQGLLNGLHYAPNAMNTGRDRRAELLRAADLARVGLAGTLRDYEMTGADGVRRKLSAFDYAGGPAGYAQEPGEVVNYVENHDNLTLFDLNALRLPRDISREERARAQMLGVAFTAFSQGVAYFHAGVEILRSKSLDRNSFNSGDWFNRLDWSYRDNGFGGGVPRAEDNRNEWPLMKPVLADARIKPAPRDIRWMRDASLDLLRIRASSTLFRMRTSEDVQRRLRFVNVGPSQNPVVIGALLDGEGYAGAGFREVLYLINVSGDAQEMIVPEAAGRAWMLHPVQRAANAADRRARTARIESATGRVRIPARTAVVFVRNNR